MATYEDFEGLVCVSGTAQPECFACPAQNELSTIIAEISDLDKSMKDLRLGWVC